MLVPHPVLARMLQDRIADLERQMAAAVASQDGDGVARERFLSTVRGAFRAVQTAGEPF